MQKRKKGYWSLSVEMEGTMASSTDSPCLEYFTTFASNYLDIQPGRTTEALHDSCLNKFKTANNTIVSAMRENADSVRCFLSFKTDAASEILVTET
jgi:hypothetical protein